MKEYLHLYRTFAAGVFLLDTVIIIIENYLSLLVWCEIHVQWPGCVADERNFETEMFSKYAFRPAIYFL